MADRDHPTRKPVIGCVSFLNARPLIDTLDTRNDLSVRFDVPSGLLEDLNAGEVDIALCPVIDYQRSAQPLAVVPVGGIGCDGPTFTVRLFSRIPFNQVAQIHADTDSHTSVALMQVVLRQTYQHTVDVVDHAPAHLEAPVRDWPEALLLIGDKVVTRQPPERLYPHQLDLGQAWKDLTGLPFVFAAWMTHPRAELGGLPGVLDEARKRNAGRIDAIVAAHAASAGWPADLAADYLGRLLKYDIGPPQLEAMQRFWQMAGECELIETVRPLSLYPPSRPTAVS
jgi:chorismate dehydratase